MFFISIKNINPKRQNVKLITIYNHMEMIKIIWNVKINGKF